MTTPYEGIDEALARHTFLGVEARRGYYGCEWTLNRPPLIWIRGARVTENDFLTTNDPSTDSEVIQFESNDNIQDLHRTLMTSGGDQLNIRVFRALDALTIQSPNPLANRQLPCMVDNVCPGDVCDVLIRVIGANRTCRRNPLVVRGLKIQMHRKTILCDRRFFAAHATPDQVDAAVCIILCVRRLMNHMIPIEMEEEMLRWTEIGVGYLEEGAEPHV